MPTIEAVEFLFSIIVVSDFTTSKVFDKFHWWSKIPVAIKICDQ